MSNNNHNRTEAARLLIVAPNDAVRQDFVQLLQRAAACLAQIKWLGDRIAEMDEAKTETDLHEEFARVYGGFAASVTTLYPSPAQLVRDIENLYSITMAMPPERNPMTGVFHDKGGH